MPGLFATAVLIVVVHNTAQIQDTTLNPAKKTVEDIFGAAGIQVRWEGAIEPTAFGIHLIIRRQPGAGPGAMVAGALGTTVSNEDAAGGSSFIFYERVIMFAHKHARPVEAVLAYTIALGHVLLPARRIPLRD